MSKQILKQKEKVSNKDKKLKLMKIYQTLITKYKHDDSNETIRKYLILSQAYKIGKQLYGVHYNISNVCIDFDLPYTTVKRLLSLDKANSKTWKLIKERKISSSKVSEILMSRDTTKQDEVIDYVIKNNISTYKIRDIKIGEKSSITLKEKKALDEGFSSKRNAWKSFSNALEKFNLVLDIHKEQFPENKDEIIIERLKELQIKIDNFINEINKE